MLTNDAERMKLVRKILNGVSQRKLADAISLPWHKIRDVEAGKTKISVEIASALEENFDINFRWMMTGRGNLKEGFGEGVNAEGQNASESGNGYRPVAPGNATKADHIDTVCYFDDKVRAKNVNRDLLKIEQTDRDTFLEVVGYIKGVSNSLQKPEGVYTGKERRRGERRKAVNQPATLGKNRRSGTDRRKAASGKK